MRGYGDQARRRCRPGYPAEVIRWRSAVVAQVRREWPGAVELEVITGDGPLRALAYPELTGRPQAGDRVLLNATAVELGLGTGGYALVIAVPDRLPTGPPGPGHLVKARYTPLQACVLGADEQGSPHHEVLRDADDLAGMPVVVADLHSALPAILAGLREGGPRVAAYVMLDGGTLPAWFSRAAAGLREAGWLAGTISTGQSFGGDLPRQRHRGISHHSLTAYGRVALAGADVVVPTLDGDLGTQVAAQAQQLAKRHRLVSVATGGLLDALAGCPVPLATMGRGLAEDQAYFLAAAAAGRHAAALLT